LRGISGGTWVGHATPMSVRLGLGTGAGGGGAGGGGGAMTTGAGGGVAVATMLGAVDVTAGATSGGGT
jgi:hypothetical protein